MKGVKFVLKILMWLFCRIPIVGNLAKTNAKAQQEATIEMLLTLIFSTLPIWFGGLRGASNKYFNLVNDPKNINKADISFLNIYWDEMVVAVSNGELLMYSAALLGPTLYLAFSSFAKRRKPFPWVRPQIVLAVLLNFIGAELFFAARENSYSSSPSFIFATLCFYGFALILLFPAMAYEHDRSTLDLPGVQRDEQNAYQDAYKKHRGQ